MLCIVNNASFVIGLMMNIYRLNVIALAVSGMVCTRLIHAAEIAPTVQLSPVGFSGAINTPTADVVPWGGRLWV